MGPDHTARREAYRHFESGAHFSRSQHRDSPVQALGLWNFDSAIGWLPGCDFTFGITTPNVSV
jgi:hypothetical protein